MGCSCQAVQVKSTQIKTKLPEHSMVQSTTTVCDAKLIQVRAPSYEQLIRNEEA